MNSRFKLALIALSLCILCTSCKLGRFVIYNFADIKDYKKFPARTIEKGDTPFMFVEPAKKRSPKSINYGGDSLAFDDFLEQSETVAFVIIQRDTIQYEKYFDGYDQESIVPSFSMAKSFISLLIGCAIDDGLILSVDEPVRKYVPELKASEFDQVTIEHLLQMTSGLNFNEGYKNPFGHAASFYYGRNLQKEIKKLKLKAAPGKEFDYVSGNSQLLGFVLERALKAKSISAYFEEKIWKELGMEYDASWSLDRKKEGIEKTFCCVNARTRDFAKIGRLYLHKGNWEGKQIVSEKWVEKSTAVDHSRGSANYYQYQWWLPSDKGDFMAEGILGQFVYVNPDKDLIIVRLGKSYGKTNWSRVLPSLGKAY